MEPSLDQFNNPPPGSLWSSQYLNPDYWFEKGIVFLQNIFSEQGYHILNNLTAIFAMFFLAIIAYTSIRLLEIRRKEHHHLAHEIAEYAHHQAEREKRLQDDEKVSKNESWRKVLQSTFSASPADWKLAVIEADTMLEALMGELGFLGNTLGDKLKSANQENFRNLTAAWEVHNIRNRIAHEGAAFPLSQHEAKRVIALYEQIFREFGYI